MEPSSSMGERRLAALVIALSLAAWPALAQSTASTTTQQASSLPLYTYPGFTLHVSLDTIGRAVAVATPRALAFRSLRAVYAELKVPLTDVDSAAGWLGTLRLIRTQSLGRFPLSRLLDCGRGMNGPVADNARVQMALVSFVSARAEDSASVRTALVASAQSLDGASGDRAVCSSTGFLESWMRVRLLELVRRG